MILLTQHIFLLVLVLNCISKFPVLVLFFGYEKIYYNKKETSLEISFYLKMFVQTTLGKRWRGQDTGNALALGEPKSTYYTATSNNRIPQYYATPDLSNELYAQSEENAGFPGGVGVTLSNSIRSNNTKGRGNYPISKPGLGNNSLVLPIYTGENANNKGTVSVPPVAIGSEAYTTEGYGGGNGQYNLNRGSFSPTTKTSRSTVGGRQNIKAAGYSGSMSPTTKQPLVYGGNGSNYTATNQPAPRVGNVHLPGTQVNYPETRNYSTYKSISSNWKGTGNLGGNYGIASTGTNSGPGGTNPFRPASNYLEERVQNRKDSLVQPRYFY